MASIVRQGLMSAVRRAAAAVALLCALGVPAPSADAAITSVFTNTPTPVPCIPQTDGVRLCSGAIRSTVKTFDGVPIDVAVAFPPQPSTGSDGPYPLIIQFHPYGHAKGSMAGMRTWLTRGYATLSMTTRGFGESCGSSASRQADPAGCAKGYVRFNDARYEIRDAQEFAGLLADESRILPTRIGAIGGSYGGAMSMSIAALKDRKMLPDGSLVSWRSPVGKAMRIAAAAPELPWSDIVDSLMPNGGTLDYIADARYRGRTGVRKESLENMLYNISTHFFIAPRGADPGADLTGWHDVMAAGEPYDDSSGRPLPAVAGMRDELTAHHSAYYIDHSRPPAPMLIVGGWNDDLFPADEAIRMYNRTRTEHPGAPIAMALASVGHQRAQNRQADWNLIWEWERLWFEYYVKGVGSPPRAGVQALTQVCPSSSASGGPYSASDYARLAPGEVRFTPPGTPQTIVPGAGDQAIADAFEPLGGGQACVTTSGATQPGTATYRMNVGSSGSFTLLGSPTVIADIASPGANSQIAARLLDVDPAGTQTLIARGLWRPATGSAAARQVFQLHSNGWRFDPGHQVKLELLPKDPTYGATTNGQQNVTVTNIQLRLPVLEQPGALGGRVTAPGPKVIPSGTQLASNFQALTYARPKGATPLRVSLVPAYESCVAPNRTHGPPLGFGSCSSPRPVSDVLTVGTPDANGRTALSTGWVRFQTLLGNIATPADEADVRVTVSLTDVRKRSDLSDYTGELRLVPATRVTDRSEYQEPATMQDSQFAVTVPCAATQQGDTGATCSVQTTFDAVVPGAVTEARRALWQLGAVEIQDGGADGLAATTPNEVFARQGLFIP
jgi:predicted acyl esterase